MAKRKASALDLDPGRAWDGLCIDGCIDRNGRVAEGLVVKTGYVWILRSELAKAEEHGWRATPVHTDNLVMVVR